MMQTIIFDAGSGMRGVGNDLFSVLVARVKTIIPSALFASPISIGITSVVCRSSGRSTCAEARAQCVVLARRGRFDRLLSLQMNDAHFPVKWEKLPSKISCHQLARY